MFEALGLEDLEHIAGGVPIDMIYKMAPDMIPELAPELAAKLDAILAQASFCFAIMSALGHQAIQW